MKYSSNVKVIMVSGKLLFLIQSVDALMVRMELFQVQIIGIYPTVHHRRRRLFIIQHV